MSYVQSKEKKFKMFIKRFPFFLCALCCLLMLSGCSTTPGLEKAPMTLFPVSELENGLPPYKLQIGDALALKLLLNPELNEDVTIRPDGKISTAVAQNIMAFGKTPEKLQAELNGLYEKHLSNPDVAVIVKSFSPSRYYILGEVEKPGEYISIGRNLTLLQALSMAGDIKHSADIEEIVIIRHQQDGADPKSYYADYNMATKGVSPSDDVPLAANDVIFIPRTRVAEAYVQYEQLLKQFVDPSLGVSFSHQLNK